METTAWRHRKRAEAEANSAEYRQGAAASSPASTASSGRDNWNFYCNKIQSKPRGAFIEDMLASWHGDYDLLESHHGFIQWLFPLRESGGLNWHASPLAPEEARRIGASAECRDRLLRAYQLMLDFYGFRLADAATGAVAPAENATERVAFLNCSSHNYLRISRILKCLGDFGLEHFKAPWVKALALLCFQGERPPLRRARNACEFHWVYTLRAEAERLELLDLIDSLVAQFPQQEKQGR